MIYIQLLHERHKMFVYYHWRFSSQMLVKSQKCLFLKSLITKKDSLPQKWKCQDPSKMQMSWFLNYIFFGEISITSLAHQCILCSEWVPSEWESIQLIKTSICFTQLQSISRLMMDLFLTNMQLFISQEVNWCCVDYCDAFISCLDSHSDGTHSLQRILWWATYLFWWRSKLIFIFKCLKCE